MEPQLLSAVRTIEQIGKYALFPVLFLGSAALGLAPKLCCTSSKVSRSIMASCVLEDNMVLFGILIPALILKRL